MPVESELIAGQSAATRNFSKRMLPIDRDLSRMNWLDIQLINDLKGVKAQGKSASENL
ncbi:MAG: hypothetical protein WBI44_02050 [Syntrophaceticus sp.]